MTPRAVLDNPMNHCLSYLDSVLDREKRGAFLALQTVDWKDKPSPFKIYRHTRRIPLPECAAEHLGDMFTIMRRSRTNTEPEAPLTLHRMADLLFLANGVTRRKVDITWNRTHLAQASLEQQFSRPAASGGGLYPLEYYLVTGAGQAVPPGIYHYDNAHHGLDVLLEGNVIASVRESLLSWADATRFDTFLLLSVNFWKNCFKYGAFGYHVVTQDVGAGVATVEQAATALGLASETAFWFSDQTINHILGLNGEDESVMAIVGLRGAYAGAGLATPGVGRSISNDSTHRDSWQRSSHVEIPTLLRSVHAATVIDCESRPVPSRVPNRLDEVAAADDERFSLGPSASITTDLYSALLNRSSSWGAMRASPRMTRGQLAFLLRYIEAGRSHISDLGPNVSGLTRTMLFVNHVDGLQPAAYAHESPADTLRLVGQSPLSADLQEHYFLSNYNLEQAAVVLVVVADIPNVFAALGSRGLRVLNAEVGMVAQHAYTAAAALHLGGGALLGFDNLAVNSLLGLSGTGATSMLLFLAGPQVPAATAFDFRLF